jgi:co-chaperonin GroES (HSP10)
LKFDHRATGDRIILNATPENITEGGIFIPRWDNKESDRGTVVAVGPNVVDSRIIPGVELIFGRFAATHFKGDSFGFTKEYEFVVIREEDVMMILQPKLELKSVGNH